jgi:uncharacterized FAD-dependent dehydrogenase
MGHRPIILGRDKAVRERTVDTWGLWRKRKLEPESNVQFGEGRGKDVLGRQALQRDPRPEPPRPQGARRVREGRRARRNHVRQQAPHRHLPPGDDDGKHARDHRSLGGEIRFTQRVDDVLVETAADGSRQLRGVVLASGEELLSDHVVLAVGHSARDTFFMLHDRGVYMEAKPFSIGFRVEHPQSVIDKARFGSQAGHPILRAADYKLVHHCKNGRSVYSFCTCPGGTVVAATSEPERVVTNGMSQYSPNKRNANAAIVVGIEPQDFAAFDDSGSPLAGIALQRAPESRAYELVVAITVRRRSWWVTSSRARRRASSVRCSLPTSRVCA